MKSEMLMLGFAIIFTRLSDGIGREAAVVIAYVFFAAFSLGGGLAQTLNQLIALRVLQGVGGSGLYSMLMVIGVEITPVQYWGALSGMIGAALATGSVLGICSLPIHFSLRHRTTLIVHLQDPSSAGLSRKGHLGAGSTCLTLLPLLWESRSWSSLGRESRRHTKSPKSPGSRSGKWTG